MQQPISFDEIEQLPLFGRVAFAARCARRVLPLCEHHWGDAHSDYQATRDAVLIAETPSQLLFADGSRADVVSSAMATVSAIASARATVAEMIGVGAALLSKRSRPSADDRLSPLVAVSAAVRSAASAAHCATTAARSICKNAGEQEAATSAAHAAKAASLACRAVPVAMAESTDPVARMLETQRSFHREMRRDFDMLADLASSGWNELQVVPPETFGAIWSHGLPELFPS